MTMTDEIRATNGHAKGRAAPQPTISLSSGYSVRVNRQPRDVWVQVQAAARRELETEKPVAPTQSVETEPGVFREIANENDPAHIAAVQAWENKIGLLVTEKLFIIMTKLAIEFDVDDTKLAELRTFYTTIGVELPEDPRAAWLSWVIAPTQDDQAKLFVEVYSRGLPTEQQVTLQRAMFPGIVSGDTA